MPIDFDSLPDYTPSAPPPAETYEEPATPDPEPAASAEPAAKATDGIEPREEPIGGEPEPAKVEAKAEGAPAKTEDGKEAEPAVEAKPVVSEAELSVLQLACDALGIPETDPAKQAEAIKAKQAEITASREQEAQAKQQSRTEKAEAQWKEAAEQTANASVWRQLKEAGWEIDTPDLWNPATWANTDTPNYHELLAAAFHAVRSTPEVEALHDKALNSAKGVYEARELQISETLAKYPHHDPTVADLMRENNVDPTVIDTVARSTHEHAQKLIATTNSALSEAQKTIESLRGQVSGHDAALKAAVADERKRILAELGKSNPASGGNSAPPATETNGYKPSGLSGLWDRIPNA